MSVNSVSLSTVKPTTNKNFGQKVKEIIDVNHDGDIKQEAMVGLSALGAIALGILALKKGKKVEIDPKATQQAAQNLADNSPKTQEATQNIVETVVENAQNAADKVKAQHEAAQAFQAVQEEKITERMAQNLEEAKAALNQGSSISQAKKTATRNLNKTGKQANKEALKSQVAELRQQQQKAQELQQQINSVSQSSSKQATQATHNITSKTQEGLNAQVEIMQEAASDSRAAANAAQLTAQANPTSKNNKTASRLRQKADSIEAKSKQLETKNTQALDDMQLQDELKLERKLEWMEHQTEESREKLDTNKSKTQANAIARQAKSDRNKAAYQRTYKKFKNSSKEKIQHAINISKNKHEKSALEDLLAQMQ